MARIWREGQSVSKKEAKRTDIQAQALRAFFSQVGSGQTIDAVILAEEEDHIMQGGRVYMPSSAEFVEKLWKARLKVDVQDIGGFPRCFSVAWPAKTVVESIELPGCMVWFGHQGERQEVADTLEKYVGHPVIVAGYEDVGGPDSMCLHVSWHDGVSPQRPYLRVGIPDEWIAECLRSAEDLEAKLSTYDWALKLDDLEVKTAYVLVRTVLHMMVYATAKPDACHEGWPSGSGVQAGQRKRLAATVVDLPDELKGTHASPSTHWREWHLRSYPRKRDGSRREGVVFVHGTWVNPVKDAMTVGEQR